MLVFNIFYPLDNRINEIIIYNIQNGFKFGCSNYPIYICYLYSDVEKWVLGVSKGKVYLSDVLL